MISRHYRQYFLVFYLSLALLSAGHRSSSAFSSFEIFGGAYHQRLTEDALRPLGFSPEALKYVDQGLLEPDKFYRGTFTSGSHHFTEMDFAGSLAFLEHRFATLVRRAGECPLDYQAYRETLTLFGGYLHTTQDFYAHSNWVERTMLEGKSTVPLVEMSQMSEFEELVCPYFLYTSLPPAEVVNKAKHEKRFGREFYSEQELAALSAQERINLTANPQKALIHRSLAKDDPDYPQAQLRWTQEGPTLFELAYDAGVRDTKIRWQAVRSELQKVHPARAEAIIALLRSGWASDLPEAPQGQAEQSLSITKAEIEIEPSLDLHVRLEIKPKYWNKEAGERAIQLFHLLTSDQVAGRNQRRRGLQSLSFRKNELSKTFDFSMRADLYGGSQTFLLLTPSSEDHQGSWELTLELPRKLLSGESVVVKSSSGTRKIGPRQFLIHPPSVGWELPEWVKEYVEDSLYRPENKLLLDTK